MVRAGLALILTSTLGFAAVPSIDSAALDKAVAALRRWEWGQPYGPLDTLNQALAAAQQDVALRRDLEKRLAALLQGQATRAAQDFACRALSLVGEAATVPALSGLLANPDLSHLARYALERNPDPAALEALRAALSKTTGRLRVGVINSLGARGDRQAVPRLVPMLKDPDLEVVAAAALALGKMPTAAAVQVLQDFRATASPTLQATANEACLQAARILLEQGDREGAAALFVEFFKRGPSGHLRAAGFEGLVAARPAEAEGLLVEALGGQDSLLRNVAARLIGDLPGSQTPPRLLDALPKLPPDGQVALLETLRSRHDAALRAVVLPLLESREERVRLAVVRTLALVGTAADTAVLARLAATGQPAERQAAQLSLVRLPGNDVNDALLGTLAAAEARVRVELLRSLAARGARKCAAAISPFAEDADDQVRRAALEALGTLGDENQVPVLARRLVHTQSAPDQAGAASALDAVCARAGEKTVPALLAGLQNSGREGRTEMLRLLGVAGGRQALEAVRGALADKEPQVRESAIRVLAEWSDPAAAPDLLQIVRTTGQPALRVLAFRGYVRLAQAAQAPPTAKLQTFSQALALATSAPEKRLVIAAFADLPTLEALRPVAGLLSDPALAEEASAAVVRIAAKLDAKGKQAAAPALEEVLKAAKSEAVLTQAWQLLQGAK